MRKLCWFSLGFGAACLFGFYVGKGLVAGLVLFAVASVILWRKFPHLGLVLAIFLGLAAGFGRFAVQDYCILRLPKGLDGQTLELTAECTDFSVKTDYGCAVEGKLLYENRKIPALLYLNGGDYGPGDCISGSFRLRYTARSQTACLTAYQNRALSLLPPRSLTVVERCTVLRRDILNRLDALFPGDTAPIARALLLGDADRLTFRQDYDLRISGIRHVIAVSGLHVSVLMSGLYLLCLKRKWLMLPVGLTALFVFAACAGFSPSVCRACLMHGLMLLALVLGQEYDPPTSLAFAVVVLLTVRPQMIGSVRFQLSVSAVVGLLTLAPFIAGRMQQWHAWGTGKSLRAKLWRWFTGALASTVSASLATMPLTVFYFGLFSTFGFLTNLLVLWAVSGAFLGILAALLTSLFWMDLGKIVAWLVSWLLRYVLGTAHAVASLPGAAVYINNPYTVCWVVFLAGLIVWYVLFGRKQTVLALTLAVVSLSISLLLSWTEPLLWDFSVTMLDVGQGQCILLESRGKAFLVDCGGSGDVYAARTAVTALQSRGIARLDGVILTHYDRDHTGGLSHLLSVLDVASLYVPDAEDENQVLPRLEAASGCGAVRVSREVILDLGRAKVTIFPPAVSISHNDSSLAVLFQSENCGILITGDRSGFGERRLVRDYGLSQVDILVAGHHGAASSTCPELLAAVQPKIALISVSEHNNYNQPHPDTLTRLREAGCTIYRTDQSGTITIRR